MWGIVQGLILEQPQQWVGGCAVEFVSGYRHCGQWCCLQQISDLFCLVCCAAQTCDVDRCQNAILSSNTVVLSCLEEVVYGWGASCCAEGRLPLLSPSLADHDWHRAHS